MLKIKAFLSFAFAAVVLHSVTYAQVYDPVKWSFNVKEISANEAEVQFTATIEKGWHIYANDLGKDEGPLPTVFNFEKSNDYELVGGIKEGKYMTEYDPNFEMELRYYENSATFTQKLKKLSDKEIQVKGELSYMVCDADKCLPPDYIPFDMKVKKGVKTEKATPAQESKVEPNTMVKLSAPASLESQIFDPVKWSFSVENETDSTALLVAEAEIDDTWHIYGMNLERNDGPVATSLNFTKDDTYELVGKPQEGKPIVMHDNAFDMELSYFEGNPRFTQKVRKLSDKPAKIGGYVTFMVCDDEKCLPPTDIDFTYTIAAGKAHIEKSDTKKETTEVKKVNQRSNWGIFIIAFLSGFAALLTPCVFPMIPMTVSFFTKQSKTRAIGIKNAVIYGLSIIGLYVFLGVVVTWAFGADILSNLSTDPWFNVFFFFLLVVFAISFLGAFEITLPSSWINKADSKADKGGLVGIFFMAFVLALVSFSCTGPIVGTLIVEAATRGGIAPAIGMLGFSLAIALPFGLFAAFPGWLNSLPQSGG